MHRLSSFFLLLSLALVLCIHPVTSRPAAAALHPRLPDPLKKPATKTPVTPPPKSPPKNPPPKSPTPVTPPPKSPPPKSPPPKSPSPAVTTPKTGPTTKPPVNAPSKSPTPAKSSAPAGSSAASCPLQSSTKPKRDIMKRSDVCGINVRQQNLARDGCTANSESITFTQTGVLQHSQGQAADTQCDHILELQIVKAALQGTICDALNKIVGVAEALEVSVNGLSVVKQSVLQTLSVKLNGDARNLYYLGTAENRAKGAYVGNILAGHQPGTDQVSNNIGSYIRFVDGTRGAQPVTEFAGQLDQVVDNILSETAQQAKAAINDKLEKGGTERTVMACTAQLAEIDTLLAGASHKGAITQKWNSFKSAAVSRQ